MNKKTTDLFALASDYWVKGSEGLSKDAKTAPAPEDAVLPGPNAVPKDTRVVVNIPAYRMDVFQDGSLVKSYKIGIGYPAFPLPTGLRKAQTIIFQSYLDATRRAVGCEDEERQRGREGGGWQQAKSTWSNQDTHWPAVADSRR